MTTARRIRLLTLAMAAADYFDRHPRVTIGVVLGVPAVAYAAAARLVGPGIVEATSGMWMRLVDAVRGIIW